MTSADVHFEVLVGHHSGYIGVHASDLLLVYFLLPSLVLWPKDGYSWQADLVQAILSEKGTESAWVIET